MSWTDEQKAAIYLRGKNLLVSAAAGSGKTAVLIERIISIITDDSDTRADIDRILVVTFTKAAAAEMKSRLRARLTEMLLANPENPLLQRQLALLPRAQVSTFDSLCQKIVRENFMALNVDPSFKTGSDEELFFLREEALDSVFEQLYERVTDGTDDNIDDLANGFKALVETTCEKPDDYELRSIVYSLFDFTQSEREPQKWLNDKLSAYTGDENGIAGGFFLQTAYEYARDKLTEAAFLAESALELATLPDGPAKYAETIEKDLNALTDALSSSNYFEMSEKIRRISFDSLKAVRASDGVSPELKEEASDLRKKYKELVLSCTDSYFFKDAAAVTADITALFPILKTLSEAVALFSEKYMQLKKERRILSFSDIKLLCCKALTDDDTPTDAALLYRNQYRYVLVDEYQDTNDVEEGILEALSCEKTNNRFMVGDVKQSIYRFRQSKPELFIQKSELYASGDKTSDKNALITLFRNFRSKENVLNFVNLIFSQIMTKSAAEINYNKSAELIKGRETEQAGGFDVEVALIETDVLEYGDEYGNEADEQIDDKTADDEQSAESVNDLKALEVEAYFIAEKIAELSENGTDLSDITILLRSGKKNGEIFANALSERGIPSMSEGFSSYFELREISDILALIQIIDNPLQEIPLMTVLTSPMFRFTPDELILIRRLHHRNGYFYDALTGFATDAQNAENVDNQALSAKCASFLARLARYRKVSSEMPVSRLLSYLYDDTDYYIIAGAMLNGKRRQANLRSLQKRASDFEKQYNPYLFHFVRHILRLKQQRFAGKAAEPPADCAVKIMTVHKSKGLEFPVVFLAGCGSKFNLRDLSDSFVMHQELGFGCNYVDYENRTKSTSVPREVIKERLRRESLAEEMRLLYVALTRAKERLYVTGSAGKDARKTVEKWLSLSQSEPPKFSDSHILKARCYFDWLMPAVLRSRAARVFLDEMGGCTPPQNMENEYIDKCGVSFSVVKRSEVPLDESASKDSATQSREAVTQAIASIIETAKNAPQTEIDIDKSLSWKYNNIADVALPVKLSVSEIKTRYQKIIAGGADAEIDMIFPPVEDRTLAEPAFMREKKGLSPSEKGTAVHALMANIDFLEVFTEDDIIKLIDDLHKKNVLDSEERNAINVSDIITFLQSDIADRIRTAQKHDKVRREAPFVIGVTPSEVYMQEKDCASDEIILIHGIIDCFFEENGRIVILDYKTDFVKDNSDFENVKNNYAIQIKIYKKAVESITGKPVSEACLYMLRHGKFISCD